MSNYWLISDTHFNHLKLKDWGMRTGDWEKKLWKGIADIPKGDILIHLGDICIGGDQIVHNDLVMALEDVEMILIRGNHDKKGTKWYYDHGWDFVCDGIELLFEGHYLHLTHRPARPQGNTTWNIHGHTHGNLHRSEEYTDFYSPEYHIDISPESVGYTPLRLDTLMKKYRR